MPNELKDKIEYLKMVYLQQHYFIDRHDNMAERLINILLVEITAFSIITSIFNPNETEIPKYKIIIFLLYLVMFLITIINLFLIIRPLSQKAKKPDDKSILSNENKKWIENSSLYYRGILSQIEKAYSDEEKPSETYLNSFEDKSISIDLIQQIFILAKYSDYKRKKIQTSVVLIIITTVIGLISMIALIA